MISGQTFIIGEEYYLIGRQLSLTRESVLKGGEVAKKTVEFDARKKVKVPVKVKFETSSGTPVSFPARKAVKKKVHVKFRAKSSGR